MESKTTLPKRNTVADTLRINVGADGSGESSNLTGVSESDPMVTDVLSETCAVMTGESPPQLMKLVLSIESSPTCQLMSAVTEWEAVMFVKEEEEIMRDPPSRTRE